MCLIIVCPPGKQPSTDILLDTVSSNPHGSGWMMRIGNKLEVVKAVDDLDRVMGTFMRARTSYPNAWAVWHSRFATQGQHTDVNCHPFEIPGKTWGMVHNGILRLDDPPRPDQIGMPVTERDKRSDSRVLAEDYLPRWTWLDLWEAKTDWEAWLGNSKVVLLNSEKNPKGPILILNDKLGMWDKDNGCWYSHPIIKPKLKKDLPQHGGKAWADGYSNGLSELDDDMARDGYHKNANGVYCKAETYADRKAREKAYADRRIPRSDDVMSPINTRGLVAPIDRADWMWDE